MTNTLKDLFLDELADRYDSEKRLVLALPKLAKAATCRNLQKQLRSHLQETVRHVKKVEMVFKCFGAKVKTKQCDATIGLLKEGAEMIASFKGSAAINAALISVAQKIEGYEIVSYGCLREWAAVMGNKKATAYLHELLNQEKEANRSLIDLARWSSNKEALGDCNVPSCGLDGKAGKYLPERAQARPAKPTKRRLL